MTCAVGLLAHIKTRPRPKLYVILLRKKSPRVRKKSNYHCIGVGDEEDGKERDKEEEEEDEIHEILCQEVRLC